MTVSGYPRRIPCRSTGWRDLQRCCGITVDAAGYEKTLDPLSIGFPPGPGGSFPPVTAGSWGENCPALGLLRLRSDSFDGSASWDEFTPRVGAQYAFDSGMAYVTYSEGFRSGGFNGRASAPGQHGPLRPRVCEELGSRCAKFTMFDNRFQLNLAAFTVKYDDKQEDIVKPGEDGQATLTVVQNASSATMDGLEMDFTWVLTEGLSLRGNVGSA